MFRQEYVHYTTGQPFYDTHLGQSVPDREVVELYRAKAKQLQDMGFDKTEEELAQLLHRCRGDTQSACLSLMGCS